MPILKCLQLGEKQRENETSVNLSVLSKGYGIHFLRYNHQFCTAEQYNLLNNHQCVYKKLSSRELLLT